MLKEKYNKQGLLAHSVGCKMRFGIKDKNCPRCLEMINGAPARTGYQKDYMKSEEYLNRK